MKKTLFSFVAIVLFILATVSCQTGTTDNSYQNAIPANVSGVLAIRLQQMADKAELNESTKAQVLQILKDGMKSQNTEKLEKIFKDPEESGISLKFPIIVFFETPQGAVVTGQSKTPSGIFFKSSQNQGLVAKTSSTSKLDDLFAAMKNEGIDVTSTSKNGYTEIVSENLVCTYNGETVLMLFTSGNPAATQEQAAAYMAQNESQSALSNKFYKKAIEKGSDLSGCVSMASYQELIRTTMKGMPNFSFIQDSTVWEDLYLLGELNFEKGNIRTEITYEANEKATLEKFKQFSFMGQKQSNKFLNRFPASTLYYVGSSLNGEKLYELAAPQLETLPAAIDREKLKHLITSINGDFSFGITKLGMMNLPSVLLYAEVKDEYPMTYIQEQLKDQMTFTPNGDNAVKGIIPMLNMTIYMGVQKGQLYITNDPDLYARIDKSAENPLGNTPQGGDMKNSYSCAFINFSAINQMPIVQMAVSKAGPQAAILKNMLNALDYMEAFAPTETKAIWNLFLTDKTQNSLKTITSGAEQLLPLISSK